MFYFLYNNLTKKFVFFRLLFIWHIDTIICFGFKSELWKFYELILISIAYICYKIVWKGFYKGISIKQQQQQQQKHRLSLYSKTKHASNRNHVSVWVRKGLCKESFLGAISKFKYIIRRTYIILSKYSFNFLNFLKNLIIYFKNITMLCKFIHIKGLKLSVINMYMAIYKCILFSIYTYINYFNYLITYTTYIECLEFYKDRHFFYN